MARFWVGTSGWHYFHWRGRFYPQELPPWEWLAYYIQHFPTVELNASFYRQPQKQTWQGWRKAVPEGFRFAVKASRYITHVQRLKESARRISWGVMTTCSAIYIVSLPNRQKDPGPDGRGPRLVFRLVARPLPPKA